MLEFGTNTLEGPGYGRCGSKEHLNNKRLLIHASFQSLTGSVLIYVGASLQFRRLLNKPLHVCYSLSFPGSQ